MITVISFLSFEKRIKRKNNGAREKAIYFLPPAGAVRARTCPLMLALLLATVVLTLLT
jgi:hypothetical protein